MYDIIIIGGGAAGMTAALYSLRSGKSVLLLEKETIGGQISQSPRVENFPSIKEIAGNEFSDKLFEQILDLGAEFELDTVNKIEKNDNIFTVITEYSQYKSKAVIIAAGVKHRKIGIANEDELIGKGVSYCAVCDGPFYKDEDVCLIGDGNTSLQYAILLSNYCRKVYLCTLFDKFFGDKTLVDKIKERENIKIIHNVSLTEFKYENELTGLIFENTIDNSKLDLTVKGCFIAIGQVPANDIFANVVDIDEKGYIIANENLETKTPGVFVAGDCRGKKIRQLTTAVADGAIASVGAVAYIDRN